ncbi:MAG: hypothetical protein RBS80_20345 [Thermoguttaceae bacterium]|jgi:hypothetical protein|nr:hypothetical protein [Thermoguttaceae bacterium]
MPSDYQGLNRDILEDLPSQVKDVLAGLYADRTHFILELLQNAEDVEAKKVAFLLFDDRLEVLHNGTRLFDEADVRGVCSVGKGTKKDDLTAIGRFGIGFKSVYAITSTPEIHSGDEHFSITNCVQAHGITEEKVAPPWTTLFRFPFDHNELSKEAAFAEIAAHLQQLELRTLLFLRHIREIEWEVVGKTTGTYLRESEPFHGDADRISLLGQHNGEDSEEQWLVFRRPVEMPEQEDQDKPDPPPVEAAFRIEEVQSDVRSQDEQNDPPPQFKIVRLDESPLVVFFPTAKMTRLGFLIQGPYQTKPTRDHIPEGVDWNAHLVKETGELLVKALRVFRREGYLSPELFEILPIQREAFPEGSMFRPLFDRLKEALQAEAFLPGDDGDPIRADEAILARGGDSRALLAPTQLTMLLQSQGPLRWLSRKITQNLHPELRRYLRESLAVPEFTPDTLAGALARPSAAFIEQQSDEWMTRFYAYLLDHKDLWKSSPGARSEPRLRSVPILRLEDGRHVAPFKPDGTPTAYLPGSCELQVPFVRATIAADEQAQEFLKALGLYTPDPVDEVIASVLPKYDHTLSPANLDETQYALHIRAIHEALRTDSLDKHKRIVNRAKKTRFILARNAVTDERSLRRPTEVYVYTEELGCYFTANEDAWFVAEGCIELLQPPDIKLLEIASLPRIREYDPQFSKHEKDKLRNGKRSNKEEKSLDRDIDGLTEALEYIERHSTDNVAIEMAHTVWKFLLDHLKVRHGDAFWAGRHEWFNNGDRVTPFPAHFLKTLQAVAWLPNRDLVLGRPSERDVADLPESFERQNEIIERLGITNTREQDQDETEKQEQMAKNLGVELDAIKFLKSHREAFVEWRNTLIASQNTKPTRPVKPVVNEERRGKKIDDQVGVAPTKEYKRNPHTSRVTAPDSETATWLRNQYTNEDGQMVCQICADTMPFKKRDGKYYFEAVEVTDKAMKEHCALYLALCPVCAAKYKEFVKRVPDALAKVEAALADPTSSTIDLTLGREAATLWFVDTHLFDLRRAWNNVPKGP